jgi:hypothetical protein
MLPTDDIDHYIENHFSHIGQRERRLRLPHLLHIRSYTVTANMDCARRVMNPGNKSIAHHVSSEDHDALVIGPKAALPPGI